MEPSPEHYELAARRMTLDWGWEISIEQARQLVANPPNAETQAYVDSALGMAMNGELDPLADDQYFSDLYNDTQGQQAGDGVQELGQTPTPQYNELWKEPSSHVMGAAGSPIGPSGPAPVDPAGVAAMQAAEKKGETFTTGESNPRNPLYWESGKGRNLGASGADAIVSAYYGKLTKFNSTNWFHKFLTGSATGIPTAQTAYWRENPAGFADQSLYSTVNSTWAKEGSPGGSYYESAILHGGTPPAASGPAMGGPTSGATPYESPTQALMSAWLAQYLGVPMPTQPGQGVASPASPAAPVTLGETIPPTDAQNFYNRANPSWYTQPWLPSGAFGATPSTQLWGSLDPSEQWGYNQTMMGLGLPEETAMDQILKGAPPSGSGSGGQSFAKTGSTQGYF